MSSCHFLLFFEFHEIKDVLVPFKLALIMLPKRQQEEAVVVVVVVLVVDAVAED